MLDPQSLDAKTIVALTIWGEARGEPAEGILGVAWVIKNRQDHPRWWGADWKSVCLKPWQFSCWNLDDPNRAEMLTTAEQSQSYPSCLAVANEVMGAEPPADPTGGADSYFAVSIPTPVWAEASAFTRRIGTQRFYKVELK